MTFSVGSSATSNMHDATLVARVLLQSAEYLYISGLELRRRTVNTWRRIWQHVIPTRAAVFIKVTHTIAYVLHEHALLSKPVRRPF